MSPRRQDPDYNPHRLKCPGCGHVGRPRMSPLDPAVLRKLKLTSFACKRCFRHVWVPPKGSK